MLEFLAVVRHGTYRGYSLDTEGEAQMKVVAEAIKPSVESERLVILHSTVARAEQSAAIIADTVGGTLRGRIVLESHASKDPKLPEAWALVQEAIRGGARGVVVVTHLEYTEQLPMYVVEQLGLSVHCPFSLQKGQAWLLDLKTKTSRVIP